MNIPKPAIWAGLVALIIAYAATQATQAPAPAESDTHTHADGTVHKGDHSEHEGEAASEAKSETSGSNTHTHADGTVHEGDHAEGASGAAPASESGGGKLVIEDIKKGTGATAVDGKTLSMHYRGTLTTGEEFDASYNRGQPFEFTLGAGQVIPGWDQGIKGMKVGGKRKLTIPGDLAYGPQGSPPKIGPNATLIFEVELLAVK